MATVVREEKTEQTSESEGAATARVLNVMREETTERPNREFVNMAEGDDGPRANAAGGGGGQEAEGTA